MTAATQLEPRNAVIYRGPSLLNGEPIFVVATGIASPSVNEKTGPMVQTWILHARHTPLDALRSGADAAICGDCPMRAHGCYVEVRHAPTNVWRSANAGKYLELTGEFEQIRDLGTDRAVRIGSYGDPAAVPFAVWEWLIARAKNWTGYTHQWRHCEPRLRDVCMASCDSPADRDEAHAAGWRAFRVRQPVDDQLSPREIVCPASNEGGKRITCERCGLCRGASRPAKSIAIYPHGTRLRHVHQLTFFEGRR